MRAIGRGFMLLVLAGCAVATGVSRSTAEVVDEQPIAVPETELPTVADQAAAAALLEVRDVRIERTDDGRRVVVALTRAPERVRDFTLTSPPRVVVDLGGPLGRVREVRFPVTDPVVSRVRVAPHAGQLRVVLDLKARVAVRGVRQEGDTVIAELGGEARASAQAPAAVLVPMIAESGDVAIAGETEAPIVAETSIPEISPAVPVADAAPARERAGRAAPMPAIEPLAVVDPIPAAPFEPAPAPRMRPEPARLLAAQVVNDPVIPAVDKTYRGEKISLDFKDADIQNVLRVLADVSGLNIIATDDVQGKVTLHLNDVPWDQAFDLVLRTNRLEKTQEGNVVRVSSVVRLKEERDSLKAAEESEKELESLKVRYIRVNYARADEALIDKVKGVLTDRGAVTFDDRTNTIIVRDIGVGCTDAANLIHELDVQSPQVLIEANIVEATRDFSKGLGVQWGYSYNAGPATGNPTGMNFPGTVGIGGSGLGAGTPPPPAGAGAVPLPVPFLADFPVPSGFGSGFGRGTGSALDLALGSLDGTQSLSMRLTALEEQGLGKVISRPRVITMNNVAATIQSLTILRVKLPSTGTVINTGANGAAGGGTTATEKINTGITLVVTPQVSSDGYVLMSIFAKSSVPDFSRSVEGIPTEISREANSNVLIRNGETVVLGGIYRHLEDTRESGLPYLNRIPALGWLFKRELSSNRHEELLVFLTPKIVDAGTAGLPPSDRLWQQRRGG